MQKQDIETILASQRKFFATGKTLPVPWRLEQLKKLRTSMLRHEEDLYGALKKDLDLCHFGGGCINDTIIHLATSAMPFGGVGESGMGGYHGMEGFKTFSHTRSIVDKKTWMDLPIWYQEYVGWKEKLLRMFLR